MERSEMSRPTYTSLSHDTERCLKTKATNLHRTPPLIMHRVVCSTRYWKHLARMERLWMRVSVSGLYIGAAFITSTIS